MFVMKNFRCRNVSSAVVLACFGLLIVGQANADAARFSESRLKALGIDPSVAAYFAKGARFSPGLAEAELNVNGRSLGLHKLTFGREGELCADENFFASAAIRQPSTLSQSPTAANSCPALTLYWPTATVSLQPASQGVQIIIPPEAIIKRKDFTQFQRGGAAALLNYSAYQSHFSFYGNRSDYSYLNVESGFNVADWMVRGAHNLTYSSHGETNFNTAYIYAQKSLVNSKKLLQAGQINFANNLLMGAPLDGLQLIPEQALARHGNGVQVSGIAKADQSRVEVRQNGLLIYSSLVPAGPFTLTDVPVLNTTNDLQLSVVTPDGQQETATVTAASFRRQVAAAPESWSLAAGRLRSNSVAADYKQPWLVSFNDGWNLSNRLMLEAGAIVAVDYQGGGAGLMWSPLPPMALGMSGALSQDRNHGRTGAKSTASLNWQTPFHLNFGGDITFYSPGYRELLDAVAITDSPYNRASAGVRMGWSQPWFGSLSLSASQTRHSDNGMDTQRLITSWNRKFSSANVSFNWQHQSQNTRSCRNAYRCENSDRDSLFVNISFPLGGQQFSSYYRDTQRSAVAGVQTGSALTENSSWSLATERSLRQQEYSSLSGNLNGNMHYATAGLYGNVAENHTRSYSGTLSGGLVAHKEGIIFSPYKINDTFGVISVEPAISGVELNTPQGKVWTDWRGKAIVPGLPAYAPGRIALNTERLPENIDVGNGLREIVAGHGAVTESHFKLLQTRNGLLTVRLATGTLLPKGSVITTEDGSYITTAVDTGTVFLTDLNDKRPLIARWQNQQCRLIWQAAEKTPQNVAYENVSALCR